MVRHSPTVLGGTGVQDASRVQFAPVPRVAQTPAVQTPDLHCWFVAQPLPRSTPVQVVPEAVPLQQPPGQANPVVPPQASPANAQFLAPVARFDSSESAVRQKVLATAGTGSSSQGMKL